MSLYLVRSHPTFAVIGDSAAYGTGDEIAPGQFRGWAGFLSDNFRDGCDYFNYSRPGAKSKEVATVQLDKVLKQQPDICAVIVGGNDILRNDFDPILLHKNLQYICSSLLEIGSEIVMVELHDPLQLLKLPKLIARVLNKRVNAVNAVYRKIALEFDVVSIKTRKIPTVHQKSNWHIDRMHPGPAGHFLLARFIAEKLKQRGWAINLPAVLNIRETSKKEKILWLLRNGTPWFLKRSLDLLPAAIFLMIVEALKIAKDFVLPSKENQELDFLYQIESDPAVIQQLLAS
jgi:lysophospholipase L1-like esterase